MGKSTISMAMFNSFLYVYQRVLVKWAPPVFLQMLALLGKSLQGRMVI